MPKQSDFGLRRLRRSDLSDGKTDDGTDMIKRGSLFPVLSELWHEPDS